jgi:MYXO-CTERM domain-containing protein
MNRRGAFASLLVGVFVGLFGALPSAGAHSPPKAIGIQWIAPGRAMIETNRGLIIEAADASFRLLCNDAYQSSLAEVPPVIASPDGRVFVGTYAAGLVRSTVDHFTFEAAGGPVGGLNTVDLKVDPANPNDFYSLTLPADGSAARLWKSETAGLEWRGLAPLEGAVTSLQIERDNPAHLEALSTEQGEGPLLAKVMSSVDGGESFATTSFALDDTEVRAYLLEVDRSEPARLFVRTETFDGVTPERLLRSRDGALGFDVALRAVGPLTMTRSGDGRTLWVGGADGLWRSGDDGKTFTALPAGGPTRVSCLSIHGDALYVCGDMNRRSGVFVSSDGARSFASFLHFTDVQARIECGAQSSERAACEVPFADWRLEHADRQPFPAPSGQADAPSLAPAEPGGCAVTASAPSHGHVVAVGMGALLTVLLRRTRRRCHRER